MLLRKIKRARWIDYPQLPNIPSDDVEAEPLANFAERTKQNSLSAWNLKPDRSNLERIAVAMCTDLEKIDHFDYVRVWQL